MNYKTIILIFMLVLSVILVSARECLDRIQSDVNCTFVTPAGSNCTGTYDIINLINRTAAVDDSVLSTLDSTTGLCSFDFNQSTGSYAVVLNDDNYSRNIVVDAYTNEDIISEVDSVEENQATLLSRILDIFNWLFGTKTEVYYNNSRGYPTYDIITYSNGSQNNNSYNYHVDNMTIKNTSVVRI